MAMVIGPTAADDKDGWNKVKPSKKKQKKLTFTNISREPSAAASKSRPMAADSQGINSGTGGGNRPTKTATIITPPQGVTKKRKSLEDDKEDGQEEGVAVMEVVLDDIVSELWRKENVTSGHCPRYWYTVDCHAHSR
jgi:hypothetical protein